MTAESIARSLGGRRCGAGWIAKCPAHPDKQASLSIKDSDGKVLVHCFSGCDQAIVISVLRECGLWFNPPARTPEARASWARARASDETDLRTARHFAIAARILAEDLLEELSTFDPERAALTRLVAVFRTDASALVEYRAWRDKWPELTAGLVSAGRRHRRRMHMLLAHYLEKGAPSVAAT